MSHEKGENRGAVNWRRIYSPMIQWPKDEHIQLILFVVGKDS